MKIAKVYIPGLKTYEVTVKFSAERSFLIKAQSPKLAKAFAHRLAKENCKASTMIDRSLTECREVDD